MRELEYPAIGEKLYTDTLPNGLRLFVCPKPGYTKSYAFFATDYGGADRRFRLGDEWHDTPAGVAHFLEHKMFDMPDGNALSVLSANGADPNAFTSSGITAYHFMSTEGFYENLETLLTFVSTPYFTEESVQKEQGIIGQEIRMVEDNPYYAVYYGLMQCLFAHNPMRESVAGTVESIAEITPQTLYDCHAVFYNPSNMALCVVGDVDAEKVREIALRILPAEAGERPVIDYGETESGLPLCTRVEKQMDVSMPMFALGCGFPSALRGRASLRQRVNAYLALECMFGSSSPLFNRLYAEGLIDNSFGAEAEFTAGVGMVIVSGDSEDPEKVFEEVVREAERIGREGLDAGLFARIRRAAYGMRVRGLGRFGDLAYDLAASAFEGYQTLDAFSVIESATKEEAEKFIADTLRREALALSVVRRRE